MGPAVGDSLLGLVSRPSGSIGVLGRAALLVCTCTVMGQGRAQAQTAEPADSLPAKGSSWALLPSVYYTPETRLAAGFALQGFFKLPGNSPTTRSSNILAALIYTQNKQVIALVRPRLYLQDRQYELSGSLEYFKYPDKFYGIGNDTPDSAEELYTTGTLRLYFEVLGRVRNDFYFGAHLEVIKQKLLETLPGGALAAGGVVGSAGGLAPALGFQAVWDSRDNINYPATGSYRRIDATTSQGVWGSDYSYNRFRIDARKFIPLVRSHVLAVRGYAAVASGGAPFTQLPRLGGSNLMRGFFTGRYRDHALIAAQVEYRLPLVWRLGAVAFGSVGQVAPSVGLLGLDRFRFAGGGGLRFALVPSERVNIRMDLAMAGSSSGFYLALGEAF